MRLSRKKARRIVKDARRAEAQPSGAAAAQQSLQATVARAKSYIDEVAAWSEIYAHVRGYVDRHAALLRIMGLHEQLLKTGLMSAAQDFERPTVNSVARAALYGIPDDVGVELTAAAIELEKTGEPLPPVPDSPMPIMVIHTSILFDDDYGVVNAALYFDRKGRAFLTIPEPPDILDERLRRAGKGREATQRYYPKDAPSVMTVPIAKRGQWIGSTALIKLGAWQLLMHLHYIAHGSIAEAPAKDCGRRGAARIAGVERAPSVHKPVYVVSLQRRFTPTRAANAAALAVSGGRKLTVRHDVASFDRLLVRRGQVPGAPCNPDLRIDLEARGYHVQDPGQTVPLELIVACMERTRGGRPRPCPSPSDPGTDVWVARKLSLVKSFERGPKDAPKSYQVRVAPDTGGAKERQP